MRSVLALLSDELKQKVFTSEDYLSSINRVINSSDNVLLVTSKGFVSRGHVDDITRHVECSKFYIVDDVTPNPELAYIDNLCQQFADVNVSHVLALGGGSVMDTAKVLSALLEQQYSSVHQLLETPIDKLQHIRLTTIPTTSGTGAEITPFATVWDSHNKKKYSVVNVQAKHIILDASLTLGLPRFDTMVTALDALSHAIESLWNKKRNERSAYYAKHAMTLICQHLQTALDVPSKVEARTALQNAAFLSGLAISETKTALAHAISYPITLEFDVPHGLACSFTLAPLIKRVGAEKLTLTQEQVDNLLQLLASLQLDEEVRKYAQLPALLKAVDRELDPSRAGNFTSQVTPDLVKAVIEESME